jgi:hypothetical protein
MRRCKMVSKRGSHNGLLFLQNFKTQTNHVIDVAVLDRLKIERHVYLLGTGYCYGVVSQKASHALQPFTNLLCVPI